MTSVMEKLIEATSKLSTHQQNEYAARWLAELDDDRRWDESFAKSQDLLAEMAREALDEHRAGGSQPMFRDGE